MEKKDVNENKTEKMYTFIVSSFKHYGTDYYVKASSIRQAVNEGYYETGYYPDVLVCPELGIDVDLPNDPKALEETIEKLEKRIEEMNKASEKEEISTQQIGQATIDTPTAEKQEVSQAEADEQTREEKEGKEVGDDN